MLRCVGLPDPTLAQQRPLPAGRGWAFEPEWDGFRAIMRSCDRPCVRSQRGRLTYWSASLAMTVSSVMGQPYIASRARGDAAAAGS